MKKFSVIKGRERTRTVRRRPPTPLSRIPEESPSPSVLSAASTKEGSSSANSSYSSSPTDFTPLLHQTNDQILWENIQKAKVAFQTAVIPPIRLSHSIFGNQLAHLYNRVIEEASFLWQQYQVNQDMIGTPFIMQPSKLEPFYTVKIISSTLFLLTTMSQRNQDFTQPFEAYCYDREKGLLMLTHINPETLQPMGLCKLWNKDGETRLFLANGIGHFVNPWIHKCWEFPLDNSCAANLSSNPWPEFGDQLIMSKQPKPTQWFIWNAKNSEPRLHNITHWIQVNEETLSQSYRQIPNSPVPTINAENFNPWEFAKEGFSGFPRLPR
ncbi:MAG: hypothetical protein A3F17_08765 [Gammaproteobacteria bacterium RIFCSPHIGHO2_12_FULL_41_15]|nr:MAG: hypothetical protein A3F17_08765 [Gammaproteobacteria bacterium RIFCSPHIGHO2_12_FULL_41_15]